MLISEHEMAAFRATLRRREATEAAARLACRERGWVVARQASELLRRRFGASKVVAFGSLVDEGGVWFDRTSDIDLAAWDVPAGDYFQAVAQLQDLSTEFSIDLVAMDHCPERLAASISGGTELP